MSRLQTLYRPLGFGILLAAAIAVAACSSGTTAPFLPPPAPQSSGLTSSTTAAVSLPTVQAAGIYVSGTLPTANVAAAITEYVSPSAPSGIIAATRQHQSSARRSEASLSPILYVEFSSSTSLTLSAVPALTFTNVTIGTGSYYLALYTADGWKPFFDGPGVVSSGNVVTFKSIPGTIAITAAQPAVFALYLTTATPPPSASPTASPTPVPTPVASPNVLAFDAGTPTTAPLSVTEAGDTAAFTATISCSPNPSPLPTTPPAHAFIAQITATSTVPSAAGLPGTFTVTSGAETGACTVTITDASNATITTSVTVSTTGVVIY